MLCIKLNFGNQNGRFKGGPFSLVSGSDGRKNENRHCDDLGHGRSVDKASLWMDKESEGRCKWLPSFRTQRRQFCKWPDIFRKTGKPGFEELLDIFHRLLICIL